MLYFYNCTQPWAWPLKASTPGRISCLCMWLQGQHLPAEGGFTCGSQTEENEAVGIRIPYPGELCASEPPVAAFQSSGFFCPQRLHDCFVMNIQSAQGSPLIKSVI